MKKLVLLFLFVFFVSSVNAAIIADHNAAVAFDNGDIPLYWIEKVKEDRLLIQFPGRSHAQQLSGDFEGNLDTIGGLEMVEDLNSTYQVNIACNPNSLSSSDALKIVKGQYISGLWRAAPGQSECRHDDEDYWATSTGRGYTTASADQVISDLGRPFDGSGFGWSFHIIRSYNNKGVHDEYGVLQVIDYERITKYFTSIDDFKLNSPQTEYFYVTAPTDQETGDPISECGNDGVRVTEYNQYIRDEAIANDGVLFDQADIEFYDGSGNPASPHPCGVGSTIQIRNNVWDSGSGCVHSDSSLCVAKAKAFWWMAARMAGWDGTPACQSSDDCGGNSCIDGICQGTVLECALTFASWSAITAIEGDSVTLTVNGNNCDGKLLDFELFDTDDFLLFVDLDPVVVINPSSTTFVSGIATQTWTTEWVDDTDGSDSDPEYVFVASLNEDPANNIESSNVLKVSQVVIPGVDPQINSVSNSGVLSNDGSFSISGGNFGVKNPVEPYVWDDFESGIGGNFLGSTTNGVSYSLQSSANNDPTYTETYVYSGLVSGHADSETGKTSDAYFVLPDNQFHTVYANYKLRWRNNDITGDPFLNARVGKLGRFAGAPGDQVHNRPIIAVNAQVNHDQTFVWVSPDRTQSGDVQDYITDIIEDNWHALEIESKRSSVADLANGWHRVRLDGKLESEAYDYINYNSLSEWNNGYYAFNLPYYMDACGNAGCTAGYTGKFHFYYDNVYLDNVISRIEICDVSIWADKETNGAHCEIQIPHTTWDGSNIQFTANQGSFLDTENLWLFVIDENGIVSNGYPVSFSEIPLTTYCGDNQIQNPNDNGINEVCDTNNFGGLTCSDYGFDSGGLSCINNCETIDNNDCFNAPTGCTTNAECDYLDSLPCLDGICNLISGECEVEFTTSSCNDNNACTTLDICSAGTCEGTSVGCINDDGCCTLGCDELTDNDCAIISNDAIVYLPLITDYQDHSSDTYPVSCTSCPIEVSRGYSFDGVSNYLDVGDIDFTLPLTLMGWVKINDKTVHNSIIQTDDSIIYSGTWLQVTTDDKIRAGFGDNLGKVSANKRQAIASAASLVEGEWHHLAATINNADDIQIYVDGSLVSSTYDGNTLAMVTSVDPLTIGRRMVYGPDYSSLDLEELRIYGRVLNSQEITDAMNNVIIPTCTDSDGDGYDNCNVGMAGDDGNIIDCAADDGDRFILYTDVYEDNDGDGQGQAQTTLCSGIGLVLLIDLGSNGLVQNNDDCDDTNPDRFLNNPEVCDGIDNDCNDLIDDGIDCEDTITQTVDLNPGWNIVSINLINSALTSEDLESTYVMRYNNGWESDWNGVSGDEFNLEALRGYYVYSSSIKSLTFSGNPVTSEYSLIDNTWNLFSVNNTMAGDGFAVSVVNGEFSYTPVSIFIPGGKYWVAVGDVLFGPPFSSLSYEGINDWARWLFSY